MDLGSLKVLGNMNVRDGDGEMRRIKLFECLR